MCIVSGVPWMFLGQRVATVAMVMVSGLNEAMNVLNSVETKNILYLSRYK
jgi:hypothetical protein